MAKLRVNSAPVPYNGAATALVVSILHPGNLIVGDVIVCSRRQNCWLKTKGSVERGAIRMALDQLLDYRLVSKTQCVIL